MPPSLIEFHKNLDEKLHATYRTLNVHKLSLMSCDQDMNSPLSKEENTLMTCLTVANLEAHYIDTNFPLPNQRSSRTVDNLL